MTPDEIAKSLGSLWTVSSSGSVAVYGEIQCSTYGQGGSSYCCMQTWSSLTMGVGTTPIEALKNHLLVMRDRAVRSRRGLSDIEAKLSQVELVYADAIREGKTL